MRSALTSSGFRLPFMGFFGYDGKSGDRMMQSNTPLSTLAFTALVLVAVLFPALLNSAQASSIAPQTCDARVWDTMKVRAELETQREVMMNQNLIFKPDSILAYTCFDKMAGHAAKHGGALFTHTQYFGQMIINWGAPNGMDNAMQNVVVNSMSQYLQQNFGHSQLGGRGQFLGAGGPLNAYVANPVNAGGTDYNCDVMNAVWRAAKCANFIHNNNFETTDGFYPFVDLQPGPTGGASVAGYSTQGDVRKFPSNMACSSATLPGGRTWETAYKFSRVDTNTPYPFQQIVADTFRAVGQRLTPTTCGPAIKTGVTVIESGPSARPYDDGVCTNPGCVYKRTGQCENR